MLDKADRPVEYINDGCVKILRESDCDGELLSKYFRTESIELSGKPVDRKLTYVDGEVVSLKSEDGVLFESNRRLSFLRAEVHSYTGEIDIESLMIRQQSGLSVYGAQSWSSEENTVCGRLHDFPDGRPALSLDEGAVHYKVGEVHRDGGLPAAIPTKGKYLKVTTGGGVVINVNTPAYYENNRPHRIGGPARITDLGNGYSDTYYFQRGVMHREDGPALVKINDHGTSIEYYKYGLSHREDGPAQSWSNADGGGTYDQHFWYGMLHNLKGAAIEAKDAGMKHYFILGNRLSKKEWQIMRKHQTVLKVVENTRRQSEIFYGERIR